MLKLTITSITKGFSLGGWEAAAKFGFSKQDEAKYARASQEKTERMHISYNVRGPISQNGWILHTDVSLNSHASL